jgi:hypothetical protein
LQVENWKTVQIQGTEILLGGEPYLASRIAEYLGLLYKGEASSKAAKLKLEVNFAKRPPRLPPDATKAVQGPYACSYGWGEKVLFVSRDGNSMISLDAARGEASGFFDKEFSEDSQQFFSILGMTLVEALKYQALYFLHGACVYGNERAYLFSGHSRAGKTTAAFNLVRQGFKFVADDSLFLSDRDSKIVVSPYYTNFHVDTNLVRRCPEIVGARELNDRERGFARMRVNMSELYPDSFVPSLRPDLVIFPQIVSRGTSSFSAINQMTVYERFLKQTILAVDVEIAKDQLRVLEKLARQIRGFDLFTGPDMYEDPKILPALLERIKDHNGNSKEIER